MAKDKDNGKGKRPRRTPLGPIRVVRSSAPPKKSSHLGNHPEGVIDKDRVRAMFMSSKFVEWSPFAHSLGWNPASSRNNYPVNEWIQEKKDSLARTQAETIAQMVFDHRGKWHEDVLSTLREYAGASDSMLGILKHRMNQMISMINEDIQGVKMATKEKPYELQFSPKKIGNHELAALTNALKTVTESKHKALLIHDWNIKVTEAFTDPAQFQKEDAKLKDHEWSVEIMGGENIKGKDLQRLMWQYIDKPHDVVDVTPSDEGPKIEPPPEEP